MIDSVIDSVIGVIAGVILAYITIRFERYYKKKDNRNPKKIAEKLKQLLELQANKEKEEQHRTESNNIQVSKQYLEVDIILNTAKQRSHIDRFLIFTTHNGTGEPSHIKPYKVSVLQGETHRPDKLHFYDALKVDYSYTEMLVAIITNKNKPLQYKVDEMPDCMLKRIYMTEGIKYSEIHFLASTPTGVIYCSLSTLVDNVYFDDPTDRHIIEMHINELRKHYQNETLRLQRDRVKMQTNNKELVQLQKEITELQQKQ